MKASTICISGLTLAIFLSGAAVGQEPGTRDIELDFRFLRLGLTREAVVSMLGAPSGQVESQTFAIKHHKLMWVTSEGQKFVAAFIQNKLWRWKTCSASVVDC
jgi:hypothetical protein